MVDTSLAGFKGELVATMEQPELHIVEEVPFRVLLIGDWSGRANRRVLASTSELKTSRPFFVDRDNLDQLIGWLGVRLNIALTGDASQSLAVSFNKLDDFHPDRLFERLEIFDALRRAREATQDSASSPATARDYEALQGSRPRQSVSSPAREDPKTVKTSDGSVLERILAAQPGTSGSSHSDQLPSEAAADIAQLAKEAAADYLTPDIERDQDRLVAAVDEYTAALMNAILHNRDFQSLESAWRALDFLLNRLESGANLKFYLLDISFDEFKADLQSNPDVHSTALYKILVEDTVKTAGGAPWSVVAGNYIFDLNGGDAEVVESIASIAEAAGAPFVAGVSSRILGCESLAATPDPDDWHLPPDRTIEDWWKKISTVSGASYVGFVLPRFLLRLPYGRATEPTEEFDFEEFDGDGGQSVSHEYYLWANPAFAVVFLLAKGFSEDGEEFRPCDHLDIEGLPMHVYQRDGDAEIKPCAEVLLTLRAAEQIIDRGLMPLLSMKDSGRIRLGMFQSISGGALSGRWSADARTNGFQ